MSRPSSLLPSTILGRLRYRHLQMLDILGRTRNMRVTAEQMHMTQPAATKILGDIESLLDAQLFERLPREMRPTELGQLALRYANTALGDLGRFMSEFTTLKNGGYGHITVGAISASAAQPVTAGIGQIRRQRPQLVVKLFELSSDQLAIWLDEKKIDVMVGRLTEPRHHALFDFEVLAAEPVCVVAGSHHPLLKKPKLELADLAAWPWILYPQATAIRQLFEETFAAAAIPVPVGMVELTSIFSALELLQATDMISLQPQAAVEKYVTNGLLGQLPVSIRRVMTSYGIVTRKHESPAQPVQEFIGILRSLAAEKEKP